MRAVLNYGRLEGHWYRPEEVFSADQSGWPGDWEGRILLALSLLAQSTGRPPAYLDEILSLVPQHLNAKGYFGPVLPPGVHDEQQLAGNSWFLRALIEIYRWRKDETLRPMIETLVRNLLLPAIGHYQDYPIDPATRDEVPSWNLSKIQHKAGKHKETLDTGCAFIMLDGASAAYQLLRWPELRPLLDEMIARYLEMDFKTLQVQTHATLTALRGILRLYETDGDPRHLQIVEQMFAFYKKEAWTEIHGNYNWFCRPRWTEPCGIIDSYILAVWLWKLTGQSAYLDDAQVIFYNAMSHAQRTNGAMGTDNCVGVDTPILEPLTWEVYWCCTMRSGEGWTRAAENLFFTEGRRLWLPFYAEGLARLNVAGGQITLEERGDYPLDDAITLCVRQADCGPVEIAFYVPGWVDQSRAVLSLDGKPQPARWEGGFLVWQGQPQAGMRFELTWPQPLRVTPVVNGQHPAEYSAIRLGPMILGLETPEEISLPQPLELTPGRRGSFRVAGLKIGAEDAVLRPIGDAYRLTPENRKLQVLFKGLAVGDIPAG